MQKLEALESYLAISEWKPEEFGDGESGVCTRCGERESSVTICAHCLVDVASKMASEKTDTGPKKKRGLLLEWLVVTLLSLGVFVTGSLLGSVLR